MSNETKHPHPLLLRVVFQNKSSLISKKVVPNKMMLLKMLMFLQRINSDVHALSLYWLCLGLFFFLLFYFFFYFIFCLKQSHNLFFFSAFLCHRYSFKLKCVPVVWQSVIFFMTNMCPLHSWNTLYWRHTDISASARNIMALPANSANLWILDIIVIQKTTKNEKYLL